MTRILALSCAALVALGTSTTADAKGKDAKNCPPGLAKKETPCVPPGLARKGVAAEDWQNRYDVGDRIDDDDYTILTRGDRVIFNGREYRVVDTENGIILAHDGDRFRLPGNNRNGEYVRIGDAIVQVNRETKQVIDWIRLTDLIFG